MVNKHSDGLFGGFFFFLRRSQAAKGPPVFLSLLSPSGVLKRVGKMEESSSICRWIFPEINFIHFLGPPHDELEPPEFVELPSLPPLRTLEGKLPGSPRCEWPIEGEAQPKPSIEAPNSPATSHVFGLFGNRMPRFPTPKYDFLMCSGGLLDICSRNPKFGI